MSPQGSPPVAHILVSREIVGLAVVLERALVDEVLEALLALAARVEEIEHASGCGHPLAELGHIEVDGAGQRSGMVRLVDEAVESIDADVAVQGERRAFGKASPAALLGVGHAQRERTLHGLAEGERHQVLLGSQASVMPLSRHQARASAMPCSTAAVNSGEATLTR